MSKVRKTIKDWTFLPFLVTVSTGFIVAILDFIFLQNLKFQLFALAGLFMLLIGGYLRNKARLELKKRQGLAVLLQQEDSKLQKIINWLKTDFTNTFDIQYT